MSVGYVFDIGVGCLFAFFSIRGACRGLTGEIVSLLGLIASAFCGWTFAQPLAQVVLEYVPKWSRTVTELASSVVIFMVVSLLFATFGKILHALVKAANLSLLDHLMGFVSGGLRAFCVILFLYGAASIFLPGARGEWMKESIVMRQAAIVWPPVLKILTDNEWIDISHLSPHSLSLPTTFRESEFRDPSSRRYAHI